MSLSCPQHVSFQHYSGLCLCHFLYGKGETWRSMCGMLCDTGTPCLSESTGEKLTTGPQVAARGTGRWAVAGPKCPLPRGDQPSVSDSDPLRCARNIFSIKLLAPWIRYFVLALIHKVMFSGRHKIALLTCFLNWQHSDSFRSTILRLNFPDSVSIESECNFVVTSEENKIKF